MTDPAIRGDGVVLVCLPYAGGNSFAYAKLKEHLDGFIRPLPVELPGHGLLFNQPQIESLDRMAGYVLDTIADTVKDTTWALFGHSMGGMLGYLVARHAPERLMPPPLHLFISGRRPGSVRPPFFWTDLSRGEFLDKISRLGGIPKEVLDNRELMELFEPILYRDVRALESHPHDDTAPVTCPITVLLGRDDDIPEDHARLWDRDTVATVTVRTFPGGHFFAFERLDEIGGLISRTLARDLADYIEYRNAQMTVMPSVKGDNR